MIEYQYPSHAKQLWIVPNAYTLSAFGPQLEWCVEVKRYRESFRDRDVVYLALCDSDVRVRTAEVIIKDHDAFETESEARAAWKRRLVDHRDECAKIIERLTEVKP